MDVHRQTNTHILYKVHYRFCICWLASRVQLGAVTRNKDRTWCECLCKLSPEIGEICTPRGPMPLKWRFWRTETPMFGGWVYTFDGFPSQLSNIIHCWVKCLDCTTCVTGINLAHWAQHCKTLQPVECRQMTVGDHTRLILSCAFPFSHLIVVEISY